MKVEIINQLKDNYSFVLHNDTLKSCVIDPADSNPILNFALENNLTIEDIFITHHHKDHTSGVKGILNAFPEVNIHSPSAQIENTRFVLRDGDEVNSCLNTFRIIKTPGHTLDHIIYYDENNGVLFCGDTLFRLGCGRVFEGTLNEMFNSLQKINKLDNFYLIKLLALCSFLFGLFIITLYYPFSSKLKFLYFDIKNIYSDDGKYLKHYNGNGIWIKDEINDERGTRFTLIGEICKE